MSHPLANFVFASALVLYVVAATAQCLPVTNSAFNINGIVVGTKIDGGGSPPGACSADAGWGGVTGYTFVPNDGTQDTHTARLFASSRTAGANLDRIYIGVHIENDDKFTPSDVITLYFHTGAGAFDKSNSFALQIEIGPSTAPTNEDCMRDVNTWTYWGWDAGGWVSLNKPPGVSLKTSWDYNAAMSDPESNIWELELEIDPTALGITIPIANPLYMGAKLYIEGCPCVQGVGQTIVMEYPKGLNSDTNFVHTDPTYGSVTPAKLAAFTIGTCANDVVFNKPITGTDASGMASKVTLYKETDFTLPGKGLPEMNQNHFTAEVSFVNPTNSNDMSSLAVPNSGQVSFDIKAYGGGEPTTYPMSTQTATFDQVNKIQTARISWPPDWAAYGPAKADLDAAKAAADKGGHACLAVTLQGFAVDSDELNNFQQINLQFSHLSTMKDRFLLQAPNQETAGGYLEYLLRARWKNLPPDFVSPNPDKPVKGRWNYFFTNAAAIDLKLVGDGYYLVRLKPGEKKYVDIAVTGSKMPSNAKTFQLSPRAGGAVANPAGGDPPLMIPVKPGMMVTIVANGLINLTSDKRRPPVTADGYVDVEMQQKTFLMSTNGAYVPWQNIGALIGSFDKDFTMSFRIGSSSSFIVPDKATQLYLAVNDVVGQFKDNTGKGFELNVVMTNPVSLPTRLAIDGNAAIGLPGRADPGTNLPRLDIDMLRLIRVDHRIIPAGYVSYGFYKSKPD